MSTARILEMLVEAVGSKQLMGAAVQVTRKGETEDPILVGQRRLDDESMRKVVQGPNTQRPSRGIVSCGAYDTDRYAVSTLGRYS